MRIWVQYLITFYYYVESCISASVKQTNSKSDQNKTKFTISITRVFRCENCCTFFSLSPVLFVLLLNSCMFRAGFLFFIEINAQQMSLGFWFKFFLRESIVLCSSQRFYSLVIIVFCKQSSLPFFFYPFLFTIIVVDDEQTQTHTKDEKIE